MTIDQLIFNKMFCDQCCYRIKRLTKMARQVRNRVKLNIKFKVSNYYVKPITAIVPKKIPGFT